MTARILTVLTLAVTMTGVAWAGGDDEGRQCRLTTLKGSYVFTATGVNIVNGVAVPKAIIELIDFHGDGTLTVRGGTLNVNGAPSAIQPGTGDYTLGEDCTGTVVFIPGPRFNTVFEADGKNGWMIQTLPSGVFQGTVKLLRP